MTSALQAAYPTNTLPRLDGLAVPGAGGEPRTASDKGDGADEDACPGGKRPAPTTKRARAAAALAAAQQVDEDDGGSGTDDDDVERMNCDWQKHPAAYIIGENLRKGVGCMVVGPCVCPAWEQGLLTWEALDASRKPVATAVGAVNVTTPVSWDAGHYLVARVGLPLTSYGIVCSRTAKLQRLVEEGKWGSSSVSWCSAVIPSGTL